MSNTEKRRGLVDHLIPIRQNEINEPVPDRIFKRFICDICNKNYVSKKGLEKHMQKIHLNEFIGQNSNSRRCRYCTTIVLKSSYYDHAIENHKLIQCDICDMQYFNVNSLYMHKKIHEAIRVYV